MNAQITRDGGCLCGAVRYQVRGEPLVVGICHCADCRKESGAAFLYYGDWPLAAFSCEGTYSTYDGRSFCGTCGGRLFHLNAEQGHAEICLGSLDEAPTGLVPTREGWTKRREGWEPAVAGATQHSEDPS